MYEYQCNKCKKRIEHWLKIIHSCDCGGKLKYLYKPVTCRSTPSIDTDAPLSQEFIPVRLFGGQGDIWYWRRKARKRLLTGKGFDFKK